MLGTITYLNFKVLGEIEIFHFSAHILAAESHYGR